MSYYDYRYRDYDSQYKESNQFLEMKALAEKIATTGVGSTAVLEKYIQGVIISGYHSKAEVFKSCCLFASTVGIQYLYDFEYPMMTSIDEKNSHFIGINPLVLMQTVSAEAQILFILSHEVKHILYRHLIKFKDFLRDEVNQVLINLATDTEINSILFEELGADGIYPRYGTYSPADNVIPSGGCIDLGTIHNMVRNVDSDFYYNLKNDLKGRHFGATHEVQSIADKTYVVLNKCCKVLLGKDVNRLIYDCQIMKLNFKEEIYKQSICEDSVLFDISYENYNYAVDFCKSLMRYLRFSPTSFLVISSSGKGNSGSSSESVNGSTSKGNPNSNGSDEQNSNSGNGEGQNQELNDSENGNSNSSTETFDNGKGEKEDKDSGFVGESKDKTSGNGKRDKRIKNAFEARDVRKSVDSIDAPNWFEVEDNLNSVNETFEASCVLLGIKSRGLGSSNDTTNVKFVKTKSQVPWQSVLRNRLNSYSREYEGTKKRINRRQPDRLELSGRRRKRSISLIIGIDESGSISDKEYNYFIEEIFKVIGEFDCCLHIYEFTGKVESYTNVPNEKIKSFKRKREKFGKYRFNGGTCFQPVFDAIKDNKKIDQDSLLIVFTDGYGESEVDYKGQKERLWVVVGGREDISCQEFSKNIYPVLRIS